MNVVHKKTNRMRTLLLTAVMSIVLLFIYSCGDRFDDVVAPPKDAIFNKFYGGFDVQIGVDVKQDTDGGYLLFGSSTSFTIATDAAQDPNSQFYLVKTDAEGNEMWSQVYGVDSDSVDSDGSPLAFDIDAVAFEFTSTGLVLLGNINRGSGTDQKNMMIVYTDVMGNETARQFILTTRDQRAVDMALRSDETLVIVDQDFQVTLVDNLGVILDSVDLATTSADRGAEITQYVDNSGAENFAVLGTENNKMVIHYLDESGRSFNAQVVTGQAGDQEANAFVRVADGSIILLGTDDISERLFLAKINSFGNTVLWTNLVRGADTVTFDVNGNDIVQTGDGGFAILGTVDGIGAGDTDIYLDRTDAFGNPLMATFPDPKTYGGPRADVGGAILLASDGGFVILGSNNLEGTNSLLTLIKTNSNGELIE